jgi:hypothetical protein
MNIKPYGSAVVVILEGDVDEPVLRPVAVIQAVPIAALCWTRGYAMAVFEDPAAVLSVVYAAKSRIVVPTYNDEAVPPVRRAVGQRSVTDEVPLYCGDVVPTRVIIMFFDPPSPHIPDLSIIRAGAGTAPRIGAIAGAAARFDTVAMSVTTRSRAIWKALAIDDTVIPDRTERVSMASPGAIPPCVRTTGYQHLF